MRQIAVLTGAAAVLFSGAIVLAAASPSPAPSASARPPATPHPSASPRPSASPTASPSPKLSASPTPAAPSEPTFKARVQPLQISGAASVVEAKDGTGAVTLRVSGMLDAQRWTVDIDGGTGALPNERIEIAFKAGADITRLTMDTVRIHLTRTEMHAFLNARKAGGVVAVVSDGTRVGYAEFSAT
jgi:hypothetical protein